MEETYRPTTIVEPLSINLQPITPRAIQPSRETTILPDPVADKHLRLIVPEPTIIDVLQLPVHSSPLTKVSVIVLIVDETNHTDSAILVNLDQYNCTQIKVKSSENTSQAKVDAVKTTVVVNYTNTRPNRNVGTCKDGPAKER